MTTTTETSRDELLRLQSLMTGDEKHTAAADSTLDVVQVLFDRVLRPDRVDDPDRDRFLLSKGHGPMAYYAALVAHGLVPEEWLADWASYDSPLGQHPDRVLVPGVEIGSGSLGHGLPLALGVALGQRARGREARTWVLVGDAELDEGSNHEALEVAAALAVDTLTVVVADNRSSSYAVPGRIAARFATEGWSAVEVDGRDQDAIADALLGPDHRRPGAPHAVVATILPTDTAGDPSWPTPAPPSPAPPRRSSTSATTSPSSGPRSPVPCSPTSPPATRTVSSTSASASSCSSPSPPAWR